VRAAAASRVWESIATTSGAIAGSAVPLARALHEPWQYAVLAAAVVALLIAKRGVVLTLLSAGLIGTILGLAGAPLPT